MCLWVYRLTRLWAPWGKTMRVSHSCLYPEQIALGLTQIKIINESLTDEEREKQAEDLEQTRNQKIWFQIKTRWNRYPLAQSSWTCCLKVGWGCKQHRQKFQKIRILGGRDVIKTGLSQRQLPNLLHIQNLFFQYFFSLGSLAVVK